LLFVLLDTQEIYYLTNFCNPVIPGLRRGQSRESGLAKTAGIPNPGIPGLQTLNTRLD